MFKIIKIFNFLFNPTKVHFIQYLFTKIHNYIINLSLYYFIKYYDLFKFDPNHFLNPSLYYLIMIIHQFLFVNKVLLHYFLNIKIVLKLKRRIKFLIFFY
jgi:hypothetical protein